MYRPDQHSNLETVKRAFSAGSAGYAGNGSMPHLFHELGYAIVKSNLALEHPDYPQERIRRQYERILGVKLEERYDLDLGGIVDPPEFDVLGRLYEDAAHASGTGREAGEFYSPAFVVSHMLDTLELENDAGLPDRKFIDIACGTGAFLAAGLRKVIRILKSRGAFDAQSLRLVAGSFYGLDISQTACEACKINLYLTLLNELGPEAVAEAGKLKLNVFHANAIDNSVTGEESEVARIKRRLGNHRSGFDYILGNPPYLEAKKMPATLKETCRSGWPGSIRGAFDLYIPFILQCNRLVSEGGKVCLILPNKFTVAGYAMHLRGQLLCDCSMIELADLSQMDIFNRAMVYPIILSYQNRPPAAGHKVMTRVSVKSREELADNGRVAMVLQELYRSIGHNGTFFCLPREGDIAALLRRIFDSGAPIGDFVQFRSTVSFHRKGLRERFVRRSFDGEPGPVLKYLGGRSYAKRNEVDLFRFLWEGYYINYDQARLKALKNMLPPLSGFTQEKIVICQHAPRITAAYDGAGEFVTKDVYPIGIAAPGLESSPLSLKYLTVLLNSELMSFIYGTVYKGIQIGGGYYHYLPTWIDILPVIVPDGKDVRRMERLADKMIAASDRSVSLRLMEKADDIVYAMYDIDEAQRSIIEKAVPPWNTSGR